jgi:hypothetical protein
VGYKTEKLSSGALKVLNVPLMGPQKLTEDHFKNKDIGAEWMNKAVDTFKLLKSKGKLPYLWDRHNKKDSPATVIGRMDNMRVLELDGEPWLYADVLITDPAHQQKFLDGKTPSKSAEYQPDKFYLRGLALLDGMEGRFDFTVPDFVPDGLYEELKALGVEAPDADTVLCQAASNAATGDTEMTEEQFKAMLEANNKSIMEAVDKKLSKTPTDVDAALEEVRNSERAKSQVAISHANRQAKIEAYTVQLAAKTGTPDALLRKKLDGFKEQETMDLYFKNEMAKPSEDVRLGIEREASDTPDIDESYEEYKANHPNTTVSLAQYRDLCARAEVPHSTRFAGRTVHSVDFA